jgi:hypothetical protein
MTSTMCDNREWAENIRHSVHLGPVGDCRRKTTPTCKYPMLPDCAAPSPKESGMLDFISSTWDPFTCLSQCGTGWDTAPQCTRRHWWCTFVVGSCLPLRCCVNFPPAWRFSWQLRIKRCQTAFKDHFLINERWSGKNVVRMRFAWSTGLLWSYYMYIMHTF